jgi:hypothetical protein
MKKVTIVMIFLMLSLQLGSVLSYCQENKSLAITEYLLEKPAWGMIEWNSATLPAGFWYPNFDFVYLNNGTYFSNGNEKDYPGGRDSTAYIVSGGLMYGVTNKLTFGVDIPVVAAQKVDSGGLYLKAKREKSGIASVGDIRLFLKYHIFDRYFWSLAAEAGPTLPTGKSYDKVNTTKESATGDCQTDLYFGLKGDILLNEDSFIKLGLGLTHQFKRTYRDDEGELIQEKLGDFMETEAGFVRNFRNFGMGGSLKFLAWQATKWNDQVISDPSNIFDISLYFTVGEITPQKHGKLAFFLDFPFTGDNAPATYRIGASIKSIFK